MVEYGEYITNGAVVHQYDGHVGQNVADYYGDVCLHDCRIVSFNRSNNRSFSFKVVVFVDVKNVAYITGDVERASSMKRMYKHVKLTKLEKSVDVTLLKVKIQYRFVCLFLGFKCYGIR